MSDVPTIIVSGEADPATPASSGADAMKLLRRGVHIVAPATSHVPMFPGCVREAVRAFVESGGEAAVDAQCVSQLRWPPFAVPK